MPKKGSQDLLFLLSVSLRPQHVTISSRSSSSVLKLLYTVHVSDHTIGGGKGQEMRLLELK